MLTQGQFVNPLKQNLKTIHTFNADFGGKDNVSGRLYTYICADKKTNSMLRWTKRQVKHGQIIMLRGLQIFLASIEIIHLAE